MRLRRSGTVARRGSPCGVLAAPVVWKLQAAAEGAGALQPRPHLTQHALYLIAHVAALGHVVVIQKAEG